MNVLTPPGFCQYASGPCDQPFNGFKRARAFFAFPSDPPTASSTVQTAVEQLRRSKPNHQWVSWRDLAIGGQLIFCEICRSIRFSELVIADLTTINFNVLFELGFACGLALPVLPIRDVTLRRDDLDIAELGFLDTLGYDTFENSDDIVAKVLAHTPRALPLPTAPATTEHPIFVVLPFARTDGVLRVRNALTRSAFRYRAFDPNETPRLSYADASRQVSSSLAVVLPLLHPDREGARVHNARCAFVAGMALASEKHVLLLQEGVIRQPIDYRDLCMSYRDLSQVDEAISRLVRQVATTIQRPLALAPAAQRSRLARLDLGDPAAENEEQGLMTYFVSTAQANAASRGQARLVVGRKGTGKSAIFYHLLQHRSRGHSSLVLDLKPEGYQLRKLVDLLEPAIGEGLKEEALSTFWDYMLLVELAAKLLDVEASLAHRDGDLLRKYGAVEAAARPTLRGDAGDFSERLAFMLQRLEADIASKFAGIADPAIASVVWTKEVTPLRNALADYLETKDDVWLLVDNLDKGWPARGARSQDILLLRALLSATRKLEKNMQKRRVVFHTVVFVRNDVFERLVDDMPDRGKESTVSLDNSDPEVLQEIVRQRVVASLGEEGSFATIWASLFDQHVGGEASFNYLLRHTFLRPRDVLALVRKAADVAINRGHDRVSEEDLRSAVASQSKDMLRDLIYEIRDTAGTSAELVGEFLEMPHPFSEPDLLALLKKRGASEEILQDVRNLLLWYAFIGFRGADGQEAYSYQMDYDVAKMNRLIERSGAEARFVIHPAFRTALQIGGSIRL